MPLSKPSYQIGFASCGLVGGTARSSAPNGIDLLAHLSVMYIMSKAPYSIPCCLLDCLKHHMSGLHATGCAVNEGAGFLCRDSHPVPSPISIK